MPVAVIVGAVLLGRALVALDRGGGDAAAVFGGDGPADLLDLRLGRRGVGEDHQLDAHLGGILDAF